VDLYKARGATLPLLGTTDLLANKEIMKVFIDNPQKVVKAAKAIVGVDPKFDGGLSPFAMIVNYDKVGNFFAHNMDEYVELVKMTGSAMGVAQKFVNADANSVHALKNHPTEVLALAKLASKEFRSQGQESVESAFSSFMSNGRFAELMDFDAKKTLKAAETAQKNGSDIGTYIAYVDAMVGKFFANKESNEKIGEAVGPINIKLSDLLIATATVDAKYGQNLNAVLRYYLDGRIDKTEFQNWCKKIMNEYKTLENQ
jgi:hypothetical protein